MFNDKLRVARRHKLLSQEDLAKKVGVSTNTIGKWETGKSNPTIDYINKLSKALEVDPTYFFEDITEYGLSSEEKSILMIYRNLDDESRILLKKLINMFTE